MKKLRLNSFVSTDLLDHMVRDAVPVEKLAYLCFLVLQIGYLFLWYALHITHYIQHI